MCSYIIYIGLETNISIFDGKIFWLVYRIIWFDKNSPYKFSLYLVYTGLRLNIGTLNLTFKLFTDYFTLDICLPELLNTETTTAYKPTMNYNLSSLMYT